MRNRKVLVVSLLVFGFGTGYLCNLARQWWFKSSTCCVHDATTAELRELKGLNGRRAALDQSVAHLTSDRSVSTLIFQGGQILAEILKDEEALRQDATKRVGHDVAWVVSPSIGWQEVNPKGP